MTNSKPQEIGKRLMEVMSTFTKTTGWIVILCFAAVFLGLFLQ